MKMDPDNDLNITSELDNKLHNTIHVSPEVFSLLKLGSKSQVVLKEYYSTIKLSCLQNNPNLLDKNQIFSTLNKAVNIKFIRLFKNPTNKEENDNLKNFLLMSHRIISNKQVVYFNNNEKFYVDPLYGVYKNKLSYYLVNEIEYEEYDFLRSFIKTDKIIKKFSTSDTKHSFMINSFIIDHNTKIEFADQITLNELCVFPRKTLQYYFNFVKFLENGNLINNNNGIVDTTTFETDTFNKKDIPMIISELKQYQQIYKDIDENIIQNINNKEISKRLTLLITGQSHSGKSLIIRMIADNYGLNLKSKSVEDFISLEQFLTYVKKCEFLNLNSIITFKDCNKLNLLFKIENADNFLKDLNFSFNTKRDFKLIYVFDFEKQNDVPSQFKFYIDFSYDILLPTIETRKDIIEMGLKNLKQHWKFFYDNEKIEIFKEIMNKFCVGFDDFFSFLNSENKDCNNSNNIINQQTYKRELEEVSKLTIGSNLSELRKLLVKGIELYRNELSRKDSFDIMSLKYLKNAFNIMKPSKLIHEKQSTSIPEIKWEDIGGLEDAKKDINETIQLPLKYPKLFNNSLKRRSGLIFYGPPGSGKTLLAKAIANECSMNFMSIKGPEILNMYVGESEKNIRDIFEKARNNRPCVLFFDEIDAIAPARSKNSDSNNVMDRIVAQFMTEMDGLTKENDLIIIATTNRPDLIDSSLLRPGRFDKMVYIGLPKSKEEKYKIYKAQTLNLKLNEDVNLNEIVNLSHVNYSGADIYAVCSNSFSIAFNQFLSNHNVEDLSESTLIEVKMKHFEESLKKIQPSLSNSEIEKYEQLKNKFS